MKKFKFRYESVLKMRMDYEDKIKNELAKLIAKRQSFLDQLEDLELRSLQYDAHIESVLLEGDVMCERQSFTQGKKYYKDHRDILKMKIQTVEKDIQAVQTKLVEAMKERKIMDKLKEKAFQEFVEAINVADEKLIEEVVNYSNNKKNGE